MANDLEDDDAPPAEGEPYNAGKRGHVAAKKRAQKDYEKQRRDMLAALLNVQPGRSFLRWLLFEICEINQMAADATYSTNLTFWRDGKRHVGRIIESEALTMGATVRDNYAQLMKEHFDNG